MAKGSGKRGYHKQDSARMNRSALIIGGITAAILLLVMVVSFIR